MVIDSRTRAQIQETIGRNTGMARVGTVSTTGDTASLIDTLGLAPSGDDEFNNWNGMMTTGTATNIGDKFNVTDFDGTAKDATISPAVSNNITAADGYILWHPPVTTNEVNDLIRQAESAAMKSVFIDKNDTTVFTQTDVYRYSIPSGFTHIDKVEYEYGNDNRVTIDDCDIVWSELVDGDVAASIDTTIHKEGSGCLKLVVAAGATTGDMLATQVTSVDLRNCTHAEKWVYSTVALTAGYLQLILSATALGAALTEALAIPATTANTWTRHVIALANPQSDSAIISVGIKMATNMDAFTLYVDQIEASNPATSNYKELPYIQWDIVHGSTDYLYITNYGLATAGTNKMLKISGYQALTPMSADSSTSELDPEYIVAFVSGKLMMAHALPQGMDTKARLEKAREFLNEAARLRVQASTSLRQGTRKI